VIDDCGKDGPQVESGCFGIRGDEWEAIPEQDRVLAISSCLTNGQLARQERCKCCPGRAEHLCRGCPIAQGLDSASAGWWTLLC